jgi:hypothetical protein
MILQFLSKTTIMGDYRLATIQIQAKLLAFVNMALKHQAPPKGEFQ